MEKFQPHNYDDLINTLKGLQPGSYYRIMFKKGIADDFLSNNNPVNRKKSDKNIQNLKVMFEKNIWHPQNGECLKVLVFEDRIEIYDGQHRLYAFAGTDNLHEMYFDVFVSDDPEVIHSVDGGKARTTKDRGNLVFKKDGYDDKMSGDISAIGTCLLDIDSAYTSTKRKFGGPKPPLEYISYACEKKQEIVETLEELRNSTYEGALITDIPLIPLACTRIILERRYGTEYAHNLVKSFATGTDSDDRVLTEDSIINSARVKWLQFYKGKCNYYKTKKGEMRKTSGRATQEQTVGYLLTLSNSVVKNRTTPVGDKFYKGFVKDVPPLPELESIGTGSKI